MFFYNQNLEIKKNKIKRIDHKIKHINHTICFKKFHQRQFLSSLSYEIVGNYNCSFKSSKHF